MSYGVNSVQDDDSIIAKYQSKDKKKTKKAREIISEKVGNYYCKYIVDENGNKTLVARVPASSVEKQKKSPKLIDDSKSKVCDFNTLQNTSTTFHRRQQLAIQSKHKDNLNDVLNILKDSMGIPRSKERLGLF